MFIEFSSFDSFRIAAVGALDWVAGTHGIVSARHYLKGVLMVAVLTPHSTQRAVFHEMIFYVASHHRLPTLVNTQHCFIQAPLSCMEVRFHHAHFSSPLTSTFVVGTIDLELIDALFKVLIFEVVEVGCVAIGTCWINCDPSFNTALTVVVATAHNLHWLTEHFGTQLTRQF